MHYVRLGRLEFEPFYHFSDVSYNGINEGDRVILIHIPGGAPLDMSEMQESLRVGYEFFNKHFWIFISGRRFKQGSAINTVPIKFITNRLKIDMHLKRHRFLRCIFGAQLNCKNNLTGYYNFPNPYISKRMSSANAKLIPVHVNI